MLGRLDVNPKELEEAFGWNLSISTAFKDMKPEKMSASLYVKLAESLGRVSESLGKVAEKTEKKEAP
jgi:hypothetical protein